MYEEKHKIEGGPTNCVHWDKHESGDKHILSRGINIQREQGAEHLIFGRNASQPPQERLSFVRLAS
jgi:hypothetical protein